MCDSHISESCPADFTSYCPAGDLCSASLRQRRSKVRSRVAWFSRKARGYSAHSRHRLSSQARVKTLGDPCSSCSSGEEEEEWQKGVGEDRCEQPCHYASAEELIALRGCVSRTRALFSPPPPVDSSSSDEDHAHYRQMSLDYDHLEPTGHTNTASHTHPSCSVSVEFGCTGHQCFLVKGAGPSQFSSQPLIPSTSPKWPGQLPSSQSTPERLNSPSPEPARKLSPHKPRNILEDTSEHYYSWPKNSTTSKTPPAAHPSLPLLFSPQPQRRLLPLSHLVQPELGSSCSVASSSLSLCPEHQRTAYSKGVDGSVFKEKTDLFLSWFAEFNDQQKNTLLLRVLEQCHCAQLHLLSVHMEPILHRGCPHNCQDFLAWFPPLVTFLILSYLDPVSLCQARLVNRCWYALASNSDLWEALCRSSQWQLSRAGTAKHLQIFSAADGTVQWRLMFAERFRLRRNWLNGFCNVRTFEGHTQGISCVQFDDTRIVSGSWDKTIKVWNRRTNTAWAALTLAGHSGTVRCLHLHGNRLVSGSSDRTIKVWDLATDKVGWVGATCRATMVGHMHTVRCLQADDEKVISGSYDLTLKVWDIRTGQCRRTLRGHTDAVLCLHFDSEKVVSGSKDTTIKVWTLPAGQCQLTLHGHEGAVTCLQFDSTRIISGALDRLIKIWSISTGECVRTMDWIRSEGHTGVVRHLQADSWKIVSAADDKTLKVWSVESGERLLTLKSHTDGVTCLQFNDEVIVSGSYDKTVKLWDFSVC